MAGGTVQDILKGLIDLIPILGWGIAVLACVAGIWMAGIAGFRMYEASLTGESQLKWIFGFIIGSLMTITPIIIAVISFIFTE